MDNKHKIPSSLQLQGQLTLTLTQVAQGLELVEGTYLRLSPGALTVSVRTVLCTSSSTSGWSKERWGLSIVQTGKAAVDISSRSTCGHCCSLSHISKMLDGNLTLYCQFLREDWDQWDPMGVWSITNNTWSYSIMNNIIDQSGQERTTVHTAGCVL